jgi:hypothetical protein
MQMIARYRKHSALLSSIGLLAALLVAACGPTPTAPPPTALASSPTVAPAVRTYQLAVNPSKNELNPGEEVVLSAVPLGSDQLLPALEWSLEPAPGYQDTYGELSSRSGPSVIYRAPEKFPVAVLVTAKRPQTGESDQILFRVVAPPPGIALLLQGGGGPLKDPKAQDVLLAALPFKDLLADAYPKENAVMAVEMPGRSEPDATNLRFDYDFAKSQADQFFARTGVRILVPQGDERLVRMASLMQKNYLEQVGIKTQVEVVPGADIMAKMSDSIASGLPVLALTAQ